MKEAIAFLKTAKPICPLNWSDAMAKAAQDHTLDAGSNQLTGHEGSDSSTLKVRLERYGKPLVTMGENLNFSSKEAKEILMQLITDDGNPS